MTTTTPADMFRQAKAQETEEAWAELTAFAAERESAVKALVTFQSAHLVEWTTGQAHSPKQVAS